MEITEVKVYPAKETGRLKAYATIVFDNSFIVRDLKVIEGDKGFFVSMPSRAEKMEPLEISYIRSIPICARSIEELVIDEYKKSIEKHDNRSR